MKAYKVENTWHKTTTVIFADTIESAWEKEKISLSWTSSKLAENEYTACYNDEKKDLESFNECYESIFEQLISEVRITEYTLLNRMLNHELHDDDTLKGGVSFQGETVRDFLEEIGEEVNTVEELNELLIECGIKPITIGG